MSVASAMGAAGLGRMDWEFDLEKGRMAWQIYMIVRGF